MQKISVLCVVGARPNFMKIAPIMHAMRAHATQLEAILLHTGQHYDAAMKDSFFKQLNIPEPDIDLGVGSGSHAKQTAEIMLRFEEVIEDNHPDCVLVVGDVNSTIATALVAIKRDIPVVHVEAGLRSRDRTMPEEINRMLTDQISSRLYTTEHEAETNLISEGICASKIVFAGNVMIDSLQRHIKNAVHYHETLAFNQYDDAPDEYALVTLHRPANVDDVHVLRGLIKTLKIIAKKTPIIFPVHPRTRANLEKFKLETVLNKKNIFPIEPLGYFSMLGMMRDAKFVMTDSGGVQEETTALGVPCLTLRENTERPVTVTEGTNTIVGVEQKVIEEAVNEILVSGGKRGNMPEFWDGQAARRIVEDLEAWLLGLRKNKS